MLAGYTVTTRRIIDIEGKLRFMVKNKSEVIDGLRKHFHNVHPMLFLRSLEKAESVGDLFDILDTIPEYPLAWDNEVHRWVTTDLLQSQDFEKKALLCYRK